MRGLIPLTVGALASVTALAFAQPTQIDHPGICPPLDREWRAVANGTDLAAMDQVIARMGPCPNLRIEARRWRAEAPERLRQLAEAERQRQAEAERQRQRQAEAERQRQAEAERQRQAEAERQRQAEAERQRQAEAERQRQAEAERQRQAEAERQRQQALSVLPEMVRIPGRNFEVGRYEVTFAQWDACVAGGGCNGYRPNDEGWGRGNRPVINVNWNDAQAYVQWLSQRSGQRYRLLTEAEWEYAARAGTTTNFWWGDQDPVCDRGARNGAQSNNCEPHQTLPVGSFQPNAFGLYDVHGNVWEWVEDAEGSSRVLRGGSWINGPENLRSAIRLGVTPTDRHRSNGFRVARTV